MLNRIESDANERTGGREGRASELSRPVTQAEDRELLGVTPRMHAGETDTDEDGLRQRARLVLPGAVKQFLAVGKPGRNINRVLRHFNGSGTAGLGVN
jgi:hypothetical protein